MSIDLKKIMELDGVECAIEFDKDGVLLNIEGKIDNKIADVLADLFSANLRMARMQAHLFSAESGAVGFGSELAGFAMMGTSLSMCAIENVGILIRNDKVDLNKIYEAMANI